MGDHFMEKGVLKTVIEDMSSFIDFGDAMSSGKVEYPWSRSRENCYFGRRRGNKRDEG